MNTDIYEDINRSQNKYPKQKMRRRRKVDLKEQLISSNGRGYVTSVSGHQYRIQKGSEKEWLLWCVKDSTVSPGDFYYFDSPEHAERLMNIEYPSDVKAAWHERFRRLEPPNDLLDEFDSDYNSIENE